MSNQIETAQSAIQDVQKNVKEFVGKTHPVALIAWFLVGIVLVGALVFTAWHNWNLYARGADTDVGKALSIIPALLLDGSIGLLVLLLLTYFKDSLQWWLGALFNALLFIIVGINTSLDYSINRGEPIGPGLALYLKYGVLGSFLLCFALWEILIHADPKHRQKMKRARMEATAQEEMGEMELQLIALDLEERRMEIEYRQKSIKAKHKARLNALSSREVESAWDDFESATTYDEAETIRRARPKVGGGR